MFSINGSNRFFSLHIINQISIVTKKKEFIAITAIWFGPALLSKVVETFNSEVRIEINLAIALTFRAD